MRGRSSIQYSYQKVAAMYGGKDLLNRSVVLVVAACYLGQGHLKKFLDWLIKPKVKHIWHFPDTLLILWLYWDVPGKVTANSRWDCDIFGSWVRPRSTLGDWPVCRDAAVRRTGVDDTCAADGRPGVTDTCAADGAAYLDERCDWVVRPPVDDVPRSDMFLHDVRALVANPPTRHWSTT